MTVPGSIFSAVLFNTFSNNPVIEILILIQNIFSATLLLVVFYLRNWSACSCTSALKNILRDLLYYLTEWQRHNCNKLCSWKLRHGGCACYFYSNLQWLIIAFLRYLFNCVASHCGTRWPCLTKTGIVFWKTRVHAIITCAATNLSKAHFKDVKQ